MFIEQEYEIIAAHIIFIGQERDKLIAADPEYRTVLKHTADKSASILNVLVSGIVAQCIVNFFEIIKIENNNCKFADRTTLDVSLDYRLGFCISINIADIGERILISHGHDHAELTAALDSLFNYNKGMNDRRCDHRSDGIERHHRELCLKENEECHDESRQTDRQMIASLPLL